MIRIDDIVLGLEHLVGWEQGILPQDRVDELLTETESGLTFQAAHPMVTMKNLRSVLNDANIPVLSVWFIP